MSLEENKDVVRRLFKAENKRNIALLDDLMAPDYIDPILKLQSLEEYKQIQSAAIDAFSDFHETIENITAERDKVWVHFKVTGTHTGEYLGIAPTGKKFTFSGFAIFRVADSKIVDIESDVWDFMDLYKQIGII